MDFAEIVEATPKYFHMIHHLLLYLSRRVVKEPDQLDVLRMDVRFLEVFSVWLETWDDTAADDEESMENLRCIVTSLKLIWPKEFKALSLLDRLARSENVPFDDLEMKDFHSAVFELEAKIQQTKGQVECWTLILMRSSIQYNSSTKFSVFKDFLVLLLDDLKEFSIYKAAEIVSLQKPIDILKAKTKFLHNSLKGVHCMAYGEKMLPFLNFIGDFAHSAACLTCLYWAKESNEEIATEMIISLFDMSQKFVPFSSDITTLYIDLLKSYDLHSSDSLLLGEAVERCVDFFFDHLTIILKDDFLILRDRIIFLFTFLVTDPPREINAQEEDLIRNQIYALLHEEDAYLLLPFDEMKKDFSHEKMLLNDCIIKIDNTVAKVRQLYYGFSHSSWLRVEVEKMEYIYFVSVHRELYWIEKNARSVLWADDQVIQQLQLYGMELRFLRVFLLGFAAWDDSDQEIKQRLTSLISSFQEIWEKEEGKSRRLAHRLHAIRRASRGGSSLLTRITSWRPLASELQKKIQLSKLEIKARWVKLVHWSPLTSYEILKFLDTIHECLNDLVSYKASEIVSYKKQIETLEEKLVFLKNFLKLATNCKHSKELEEFKLFVQAFSNDAICLTFLYWAKDTNEKSASETNDMLSHMLQKIKPATPHVARLYFGTLNAIYMQRSDSLVFGQTASTFIDFFLEDPPNQVIPLKNDFQILRDDIVFLLSFLNDPPNQNAEEVICSQIDVFFWEGVYSLLPFDDMEGEFSDKRELLSKFTRKIEMINADIRQMYCKFPDPSIYNFPKFISPLFLDNLIQDLINLKERMISDRKYAPFAKYKIIKIEEELVSLRPFFNDIFNLQSELNNTWLEVVDFLHITEHIINSCISSWFVFDHPFWYHMAHLSDVIDRIKVVKTDLEMIKENTMYNARCLPRSARYISTFSEQARPSEIIDTVVGFEDEAEKIMGMLTRGSRSLDIVSIVGMGGSGKTTLAKKVSSLVKHNFNVVAFCSVSQDHNRRRLLLDIICDITGDAKRWSSMTEDDLGHEVWKSLSHQKFLIVLDDIWNTSAWNEVKSSFPDHKNGSRVMLTTRSHEVADKCKISCSSHQMRFLSGDESWELLQKKVFRNVISPPYLDKVGKRIAESCKGLPLAVVVIAGVLARSEKSLSWWSEVAQRVASYLSDEGCMKILELSYNFLPETLKPCLLYLGAFPEDERIRVKKVMLLWIAEGFIQESKTKCIDDVAKEYLHDLLDRSLIIVTSRNSNGEIKEIRVHDFIHDLCQTKGREVNFFQLYHGIASSSSSDLSINNHCRRVSMRNTSNLLSVGGSSILNVRSLLQFSEHIDDELEEFSLRKLRLLQVLDMVDQTLGVHDMKQLSSLIHLRHIYAVLLFSIPTYIPQSICNLWNIGSFTLESLGPSIHLPETFWRMKSLRHVKVENFILKFSDDHEHEAYSKLPKVVSFSYPVISPGKDVRRLLQRLPAVRKLSCRLKISSGNEGEILDFHGKLESLGLSCPPALKRRYLMNFPPTLKKLTLESLKLLWTDISAIAELHCLQVLKLRYVSIQETRLEMEDVSFQNLKFLELNDGDLVEWNASIESLPCLEQLVIKYCRKLEELPSSFGEISTLKRIDVIHSSEGVKSSAFWIQEEQMVLGIEVDVSISE